MGVYIHLLIQPDRIDPEAWAGTYDEALRLLREHPDELMGLRQHSARPDRWYYSRDIEHDQHDARRRHFALCGDMASLQTAEGFEMYRDLAHYRGPSRADEQGAAAADVLLERLDEDRWIMDVFGGKTQGRPLHFPVLAAAMLVESRFPTAALVCGDLDRAQAVEAGRWAETVLGRPLPVPVCADVDALVLRLRPHVSQDALPDAVHRLYCGASDAALRALMQALGREPVLRWLRDELRRFRSPDQLGVRYLFVDWLNAGGGVSDLCRVSCLDPAGPRFAPKAVVSALADTWATCPPESFAFLDPLQRPAGVPDSPMAQLLGVMLDLEGIGHRIQRHTPLAEAQEALQQCFPAQARSLVGHLKKRTAQIRALLAQEVAPLDLNLRAARDSAECSPEQLLYCQSLAEVPEELLRLLRAFAWRVYRSRERFDRDPDLSAAVQRSGKSLREVMLAMLERQQLWLTEDAWAWIDEEDEDPVVRFLLALACLDSLIKSPSLSQMRQAMLENEGLCRDLALLMEDPQVRSEIERDMGAMREEAARADDEPPV